MWLLLSFSNQLDNTSDPPPHRDIDIIITYLFIYIFLYTNIPNDLVVTMTTFPFNPSAYINATPPHKHGLKRLNCNKNILYRLAWANATGPIPPFPINYFIYISKRKVMKHYSLSLIYTLGLKGKVVILTIMSLVMFVYAEMQINK